MIKNNNVIIKNAMENAVDIVLNLQLAENPQIFNCNCATCINNIKAMTLNNLKPKYYCSDTGNTYTHMEIFTPQIQVDVQLELNKSIEKVNKYPFH